MNMCLLILSSEDENRQNFQKIKFFQDVTWLTKSRNSVILVWTLRNEVYLSCSDSINLQNWKYVAVQRVTILLHISFQGWGPYMNKCKKEGKKLRTHNLKLSWFKIIFENMAHIFFFYIQTKSMKCQIYQHKKKYFVCHLYVHCTYTWTFPGCS